MRIGLAGLGRIGAFHADTLLGLAAVETLVVTDARPETRRSSSGRRRCAPATAWGSPTWARS